MTEQQPEPVKWVELTDREKIELVVTSVLKWQYLPSTDYERKPEWPVVWYNDEEDSWSAILEQGARYQAFDPLHSLDSAWLIVQHEGFAYVTISHCPPIDYAYEATRAEYTSCEIAPESPYSPSYRAFAPTAPEAVCIAALRKAGIPVINVMEALPAWQVTHEDGSGVVFRTRDEAESEYRSREEYLKRNLRWAKDVRKLKIEEMRVPEDYWNGIAWA